MAGWNDDDPLREARGCVNAFLLALCCWAAFFAIAFAVVYAMTP
jgi:hypothetical protein